MGRVGFVPLPLEMAAVAVPGELVVNRATGDVSVVGSDGTLRSSSTGAAKTALSKNESNVSLLVPVTATVLANKRVALAKAPANVGGVRVVPAGGPEQVNKALDPVTSDFEVTDLAGVKQLSWTGLGMDGLIIEGDRLLVSYPCLFDSDSNIVKTGLVAEFPLTEGSGTLALDYSGVGNIAEAEGSPTWGTPGIQLPTNASRLLVAPSDRLKTIGSGDYTVICVVRPTTGLVAGSKGVGIGSWNTGKAFPIRFSTGTGDAYQAAISDGTTTVTALSAEVMVQGQAAFLAATRKKGSTFKVYAGSRAPVQVSDTLAGSPAIAAVGGSWTIGVTSSFTTTGHYCCYALVYDRELSAAEVEQVRLSLKTLLAARGVVI
jgi:hypothetical protein